MSTSQKLHDDYLKKRLKIIKKRRGLFSNQAKLPKNSRKRQLIRRQMGDIKPKGGERVKFDKFTPSAPSTKPLLIEDENSNIIE